METNKNEKSGQTYIVKILATSQFSNFKQWNVFEFYKMIFIPLYMLVNLIEKINKNLFGCCYFGLMQLMKDEFLVNF